MNQTLILLVTLPAIGAGIGWFTNFLAVKMIFRPRRRLNLLGIAVQGLLPKRRTDFAASIADTIEQELISHDDIAKILADQEYQDQFLQFVDKHAQKFITRKLDDLNPLILAFLPLDFATKIKQGLVKELRGVLPELIDSVTGQLEGKLDFRKIVHDRVEAFEIEKLEAIVFRIAKKELRYIEVLGGVLGFVIGLVQFGIVTLTQ